MTIVILIILATISINVVLGENGLIERAQKTKATYEQSIKQEEEGINKLLDEYEDIVEEEYKDSVLQTPPNVTKGMTRVKYNTDTQKWEKVKKGDASWYNYAEKEWANVVLGDATFNSDGTLNEDKPYTQLVWIPRFQYKITSGYHAETAGTIDIKFVAENDTTKKAYPSVKSDAMEDYVLHPAFEYNGHHLAGFWVGKFETNHTNCTTKGSTGQVAYTGNEVLTIRANVTSWRNIIVSNIYTVCVNMNKAGNVYKLPTNDAEVDPHMMKNTEWGAVAYLSKSEAYGKGEEEVYINNNQNYITGIAGPTAKAELSADTTNSYKTDAGQKASTSGTVWGVYDMSGGAWEYTAAYVNNGNINLTDGGSELVKEETPSYHKNVYEKAELDKYSNNYALATPENGHYGDAIYETSSTGGDFTSWYDGYSQFPYIDSPFFGRGGDRGTPLNAGVFHFNNMDGLIHYHGSFRVVVPTF